MSFKSLIKGYRPNIPAIPYVDPMQQKLEKYMLTYLASTLTAPHADGRKLAMHNFCINELQTRLKVGFMLRSMVRDTSTAEMIAILEEGWRYACDVPRGDVNRIEDLIFLIPLLQAAITKKDVSLVDYLLHIMGDNLPRENWQRLIRDCLRNVADRNNPATLAIVGLIIRKHTSLQESLNEPFITVIAGEVVANQQFIPVPELTQLLLDAVWQAPLYLLQHPHQLETDRVGKMYSSLSAVLAKVVSPHLWGLLKEAAAFTVYMLFANPAAILGVDYFFLSNGLDESISSTAEFWPSVFPTVVAPFIGIGICCLLRQTTLADLKQLWLPENIYFMATAHQLVADATTNFIYKPLEKIHSWAEKIVKKSAEVALFAHSISD